MKKTTNQVTLWEIEVDYADKLRKTCLGLYNDKPKSYISDTRNLHKRIDKDSVYPEATEPIGHYENRVFCLDGNQDKAAKWLLDQMQERYYGELRWAQGRVNAITALLDQHYPQYE